MLFRLHDRNTDEIITEDFRITPTGLVEYDGWKGTMGNYAIQKGIIIGSHAVFVGDAITVSLKDTDIPLDLMKSLLHGLGMTRTPENFDTVVIEIMTNGYDDGYSMFMFKLNGEFIQQPDEYDNANNIGGVQLVEGNFAVPMDGLALLKVFLSKKNFEVVYNFTSPEWQGGAHDAGA